MAALLKRLLLLSVGSILSGTAGAVVSRWHRIYAARMIGVALTDPFNTEPKPLEDAMGFNGFQGIGGAGGIETAVRAQKRADKVLIDADQKDQGAANNHAAIISQLCNRRLGSVTGYRSG